MAAARRRAWNSLDGPGMGYGPPSAAGPPRGASIDRRAGRALPVAGGRTGRGAAAAYGADCRPGGSADADAFADNRRPPHPHLPSRRPLVRRPLRAPTRRSGRTSRPASGTRPRSSCERGGSPQADVRVPMLRVVATDSLTEQLTDVDPAKIVKAKPVGDLVVDQASDYAAIADQRLSNKTTVRMQLVYDPASRYGWLVDTIDPLR